MESIFKEFELLPEGERSKVLSDFKKMHSIKGFVCPFTKAPVVSICELKKCKFQIEWKDAFNCLLCYTTQKKSDSLSINELVILKNISKEKIRNYLNRSFNKFREEALKISLNEINANKFEYILNSSVCVVCGNQIIKFGKIIGNTGLMYCSDQCKSEKPSFVIKIEQRFESDIGYILSTALKTFKTISILENCFKVTRKQLLFMFKKYLGIDLRLIDLKDDIEYTTNKFYRNSDSNWVDLMIKEVESRFSMMSTVVTEKIENECDFLIKSL